MLSLSQAKSISYVIFGANEAICFRKWQGPTKTEADFLIFKFQGVWVQSRTLKMANFTFQPNWNTLKF